MLLPLSIYLHVQPQGYASQIYDADGNLMQTLVMEGSNREEVSFDQLPDDLVNAFIAIEDSRFYEHNGIDLKGILRAAYVGITNGRFSEGASTITQQLIKNNVLQGGYETSMADKLLPQNSGTISCSKIRRSARQQRNYS